LFNINISGGILQSNFWFIAFCYRIISAENVTYYILSFVLSIVYDGDATDWCNTQIPDLYIPLEIPPGYTGSTGCCLIEKYGEVNYWIDEDNVRIWG